MNAVSLVPARGRPQILLIAVLAALGLALLWFLPGKWHYFADISEPSYSPYFWPRRAGLIPHIFGGLLAITAGLIQIWLGLANRVGAWHRRLGKVYVAGVTVGSLGGFYVALTIPPGSLAYQAGLTALCVAWVMTTGMALWAVHHRRLEQHRDWMLRSYLVTFAFVTFRLVSLWVRSWLHTPGSEMADDIDAMMAWACWALPLLIAETLIQSSAVRRGTVA
jgi:hypothetical protein